MNKDMNYSIEVRHHSVEKQWSKNIKIDNPKVLVLGSFNPYNPNGKNDVDYYYGRESNHFWRSIGKQTQNDESYFLGKENHRRKLDLLDENFICFDAIDSVHFSSSTEELLKHFIQENIFSGFQDQTIWTVDTKYRGVGIRGVIKFNNSVLDYIKNSNSILKVIHTMGKNKVFQADISKPAKKTKNGLKEYIHQIYTICQKKGVEFCLDSYSPSGYAVKNGYTKREDLDQWLKTHLNLDKIGI